MNTLNSDHLRTFLAIHDAGSVTGGAALIGRSQSAASLQIRQLEEVVGKPLFHRHGRGVTLTAAGEQLRPVARAVTRSLDTALADLRGEGLTGRLRIGMPDDHGRSDLARILAEFSDRHPNVQLDVHCAMGVGFEAALASGTLDLAVYEVPEPRAGALTLRESRLVWMCAEEQVFPPGDDLPVALFDRDCWWRDLALASLRDAGRPYRVVFNSESTVGVRAAVQAGIAAALLDEMERPEGARAMPELSNGHPTFLVLQRSGDARGPAVDAMCDAIRRAFSV